MRSDVHLLYAARAVRGFGDGFAVIILPAYLTAIGFDPARIGYVAAASLLGTALPRSLASSVSPALTGLLLATSFSGMPLVVCGALKIVYDVALLFSFRHIEPPEERITRAP